MQSATSSSPLATSKGTSPSTSNLSPTVMLALIKPTVVTPSAMLSGLTINRVAKYPKTPVFMLHAIVITLTTFSLIYSIAKIQLSNCIDIHNISSKLTLANVRKKAQLQLNLKQKFDNNGNKEEFQIPKKQDYAIIPENAYRS